MLFDEGNAVEGIVHQTHNGSDMREPEGGLTPAQQAAWEQMLISKQEQSRPTAERSVIGGQVKKTDIGKSTTA